MIKVLVVDDSALARKLMGKVLEAEGDVDVQFARDGLEALTRLVEFEPDVVTLDLQMPNLDGLATLDRIMLERPCPVVMVSSLSGEGAETTLEALRLGAFDFVAKPSGALSLGLDAFGPQLVAKVRAASSATIRSSHRLKDRIRHRMGRTLLPRPQRPPVVGATPAVMAATGDGLVLVGSSTGGPPALETLLRALPADFAWPILVAQHMPATFTGPLARRLDGVCALDVLEVERSEPLRAGAVYIGRGDADLVVAGGRNGLRAATAAAETGYPWHPSADRLVRTAMKHLPASQLIGVLLTGMGFDGAPAMVKLRAEGGRTIAESEETAVVWGMPGELVKAGGADFVLPLPRIAEQLQALTP